MTNEEQNIIEHNKELVARYPFLAPKTHDLHYYEQTGEDRYVMTDDYDYTWTWLDGLPTGWAKAFGVEMCEELREELIRCDYLDQYVIQDTKEKYGELRIYDNGVPQGCNVHEIIDKYADISYRTCCKCGKPATKISLGWISPWCDECSQGMTMKFKDIMDS